MGLGLEISLGIKLDMSLDLNWVVKNKEARSKRLESWHCQTKDIIQQVAIHPAGLLQCNVSCCSMHNMQMYSYGMPSSSANTLFLAFHDERVYNRKRLATISLTVRTFLI